ncbi:polysaccharide deacetylase family protein [Streptomyces chitinivorans]|uniref:Polysaccharide deacetylase family protein n=1 Tax=Streptomyces chitinivorans TaxID=1257027 RepID=A0ABW7HS47_9ACTN|nr:polysaccharide deacetylase family protein [Streptomyces chitinivorans]MDH2411440.1 polysaccharide deacetylase family protein [Streptomyces chitinivorans]
MTVSVRRTARPLTALALVAAAAAGCAGPGGDTTRAGASPAAPSSPAASEEGSGKGDFSASPRSSVSRPDGDGQDASSSDRYATLPASISGRVPVFRHGPRPGAPRADGDEGGKPEEKEDEKPEEDGENREKREKNEKAEKSGDKEDKVVALTFDAALSAEDRERAEEEGKRHDNPGLVSALRREKVPATVFMSGLWAQTYKHQARSIGRDDLFEVGNLSHSHRAFTGDCRDLPALAPDKQLADVREGRRAIRAAGVKNLTPYFRFPGGCFDDRSRRAIAPAEVTAVAGDVVAPDAGEKDPKKVAERVMKDIRPGSVVVLNCDREKAPATEKAVRRIVPELRERGYRIVHVSEMIASAMGRD